VARIYLSSTYGDLIEHRGSVYRALRQLGHDAIAMEDYVAADQRPIGKCLEDVAASDLYVGVFAHRYGFVPDHDNPDGRSITELEYRHAQALGIPRLLFLLEAAAPWPPPDMDAFTGAGDHGARIRMLREELGRERLVSFFTTRDELAQKVSIAVTKQLAASGRSYRLIAGLPAVPARRVWTIPPPVRSFTGRDDQLAALNKQLTRQGAATLVPTTALTGMGGVGKTQLALAYAQRYRTDYQLGWWVPAETELGIVTALADLGVVLGLPADLPPAQLAARARDGLGERSGWLVVFDNAPDPAAVAEFLPGAGGGHVLVTSRNSAWQGIAHPVPVDLLPLGSAVELLLRRTGDSDEQTAAQLAEALDRLPLALEQAAAYASTERLRLARYLELFKERHAELLALGRPLAYQGTVDATFTLAMDQLRATNPAAGQLLELCALLAPDEIPLPLLISQSRLLPQPLAAAADDPVRQGEVAGLLYRQGLLTQETTEAARMHRLVQDVTLAHLPQAGRHQRTVEAVQLLAELFPAASQDPDEWPRSTQLLPHALVALDHARALQLASEPLSQLLSRTGGYLSVRGFNVRLARELDEQALAIRKGLYDGDHPDVAKSLSQLAINLHKLGEVARARDLHEEALAMRWRLHEGDHPDVAQGLSQLANDLNELGEVARAQELQEQALAMCRRLYDGDHRSVAMTLHNLAVILREQGEHGRARELDEQALGMLKRLFYGDHPDVALSMNNLAKDLRALGEHGRARELDEHASAMLQRLYDSGDSPSIIELLQGGQRASAVARLEAELREEPSDAEVRNAYGFCILPDHPEEGLLEVETASELGYSPELTLANRMFGLFLLQRYALALEAAEGLFQLEETHDEAYLWDWRKAPYDAAIISIKPRHYAVQIALDIAQITGDTQAMNIWASRAEALNSD
jgi:tetratricopeptide (TPR) repeat protein